MFEDDTQINSFLTLQQEFSGLNIDVDAMKDSQPLDEQHQSTISPKTANQILHPTIFDKESIQELKQISLDEIAGAEAEVIQLKDNFLPTGLTPLEDIFDSNDIPRKPKMQPLNQSIGLFLHDLIFQRSISKGSTKKGNWFLIPLIIFLQ